MNWAALVRIPPGSYISAMHLLISFFVTDFVHKTDDTLIVVQMMFRVTDSVYNIVGKGENAGYQHFLLFPLCFQKAVVKSLDCVVKI